VTDGMIVALDIGTSKVSVLAGKASKSGSLQVLGYATAPSRGVFRGAINDGDDTGRAVDAAFRRLQADLGLPIERVYVAISGPGVEGLTSQGMKPIVPRTRHITHHDVLEVINHSRSVVLPPDLEQVQAIPRSFRVDGQTGIQQPIGMTGGRLEVDTYIVTAPRVTVQKLERVVSGAKKIVDQVVLSPLAAGLGVLSAEQIDQGVAVVDIGAGKTDIGVFLRGSLAFSASLPVGSLLVSSDVSKLLKTSLEEGERLKVQHGSAFAKAVSERETVEVSQIGHIQARPMQRRVLAEIMESRMREIAVMVRQNLEKGGHSAILSGGIVLTGGGSQIADIERLFDETIPMTTTRVASVEPGKFGLGPGSAVAVGMAQFAIQCHDEISSGQGDGGWRERVRSLFSLLSGR
jgi:cell division protein FtsA